MLPTAKESGIDSHKTKVGEQRAHGVGDRVPASPSMSGDSGVHTQHMDHLQQRRALGDERRHRRNKEGISRRDHRSRAWAAPKISCEAFEGGGWRGTHRLGPELHHGLEVLRCGVRRVDPLAIPRGRAAVATRRIGGRRRTQKQKAKGYRHGAGRAGC